MPQPSPIWPTPRVREGSPRVLTLVLVLVLAASAVVHRLTVAGDEIDGWLLAQLGTGAVAALAWALAATRLDPGRRGWQVLPDGVGVDPHSLPRHGLRWGWLRWFVPAWLVVTAAAVALTPDAVEGVGDLVVVVLLAAVLQLLGVLAGLLAALLVLWPLLLVAVGLGRLDDGGELPPSGPLLITLGLALLLALPVATTIVVALEVGGDGWRLAAVATTAALVVDLLAMAAYAVRVRVQLRAATR